jgi:hypothetical protein
MSAVRELAGSAAVSFGAALAFYPALRWRRRHRLAALAVLTAVVAASPLLVEARHPFLRLLAGLVAVALAVKLYDLHLGAGRGYRPGVREFVAYLPNVASIVLRKLDAEPRPGPGENLRRLARGGAGFVAGLALFAGCFFVDWRPLPFALEHSAKVVALFLAIVPGSTALVAAWRLAGGRARDWMDNPFAAATPSDFWRRYNRPAQQFLYEDVFKPCGGLRAPVRAALATFAVSGLVHEYLFDVASGRVRGYQTAFFLVQGLAVAATLGVKPPEGWRRAPWVAATFAFNLATGVLFFTCLNDVIPFYQRRPPEICPSAALHPPLGARHHDPPPPPPNPPPDEPPPPNPPLDQPLLPSERGCEGNVEFIALTELSIDEPKYHIVNGPSPAGVYQSGGWA